MTVDEFLTKAAALKAKGMAAAMSPDLGLLRGEIKTAADAYRADIDADKAAGGKPRSCPPPKGQAKIDSDDADRVLPDDPGGQARDEREDRLLQLHGQALPLSLTTRSFHQAQHEQQDDEAR